MSFSLWALLFSDRCLQCGAPVGQGVCFCTQCAQSLPEKPESRVFQLLLGRAGDHTLLCGAPLAYREGVKKTMHRFKFRGKTSYAVRLGLLMAETVKVLCQDMPLPDAVTFVPMTVDKQKQRGYNQSELLAGQLANCLGLPLLPCLVQERETGVQHLLNKQQRIKNLKGAYRTTGNLEGRSLLLVDDIVTTGMTLRECAATLYRAGAGRVLAVCAADAQRRYDGGKAEVDGK